MRDRPLFLYNSRGRELQEFIPVHPGRIGMYSCGLTVYNYAHVGNLRAYLFTDTLRRVLQWKGFDVTQVMNITDVGHLTSDADEGEDKMELAAGRKHQTVWEIAQYYTEEFQRDLALLNILPPSIWCKATDHIQEMIDFARVIERHGYTYLLEDGLYFDTSKVPDYGRLALLDLAGQVEGARVPIQGEKRNAADFAIWRRSPTDRQRLMEWHSPWGVGAPGWHLECSTMSIKYLGAAFDIHTGGIDHRQVHHCNEIAQNEAYSGDGSWAANYWLHNEFVNLSEGKMSKSKGEFVRLTSLRDRGIHPLSFRHFVLMATYRRPLEFSLDALTAAQMGLLRLLRRIESLRRQAADLSWVGLLGEARASRGGSFAYVADALTAGLPEAALAWVDRLDEALSRDLNTPQALALLGELLDGAALPADVTLRLAGVFDLALGLELLQLQPADLNLRPVSSPLTEPMVEALLVERTTARRERDFRRADAIRDQLAEGGVAIQDSRDGTTWEWVPQMDDQLITRDEAPTS